MKVLAIGATGVIGRHVVSKLADAGHEVAVLHRGHASLPAHPGITGIVGDRSAIRDFRGRFREWAPDVAIDMILSSAAQAQATLEALHGIARRMVAVSSADVYRAMAVLHRLDSGALEPVPLTEGSTLRQQSQTYSPEAPAAVRGIFPWMDTEYDKVQVERAIGADSGLPATILRLPMVYGPGEPLHRLYPFVKRAQDRRPAVLEDRFAQWVPCRGYVENVAEAIAVAATSEHAAGRIYNVADPEAFTEAEWTAKIVRVVVVPREKAPAHLVKPYRFEQHLFMESKRIREELGYREPVPIDEALRRTVAWEGANPPARIDPSQFDYAAEDAALPLISSTSGMQPTTTG
ncbi:MAG: NAD-dependent epimerase/dehydratase family protein [Candidatus Sulfopaludibacter sp.]|nr:NAD-dependent epimerase/dehydratase family protein [Candidatus Sulfopaludibacter sp.]